MTTTAAAIRDAMLTLVEAINPAIAAETRFHRHREEIPHRDWCADNPSACFRRVSIRNLKSFEQAAVSNTRVEETADTFEILVGYPNSARLGHPQQLELDDVIESDLVQIHAAIGPPGYTSLEAQAAVLHTEPFSVEDNGPTRIGVIRYQVRFYRSTQ